MSRDGLREASRWLLAGLALATVAFALLVFAQVTWSVFAGLAASLVLVVGGFRVAEAMDEVPEDERLRYPYHLAQRGRRLAWVSLLAAIGLTGYTIGPQLVASMLGPLGLIAVGAMALLGPSMAIMLAVWAVDGISLRSGREEPGDPIVGATVSLTLALVLAALTATTGFGVSFALLATFGGLVPCAFLVWSLWRIRGALASPLADPRA